MSTDTGWLHGQRLKARGRMAEAEAVYLGDDDLGPVVLLTRPGFTGFRSGHRVLPVRPEHWEPA